MNWLVLGATGMLGPALVSAMKARGDQVTTAARSKADLNFDVADLGALYGVCFFSHQVGGFLGAGAGAELRQPLGVSVVGGLLVSQLLTLYITPVIYIYLDRIDRRLKRRLDPTLQDTQDVEPPRVAAAE